VRGSVVGKRLRPLGAVTLASAAVLLAASCGGSGSSEGKKSLLVAVNAPFSKSTYVGETIAHGAELAAKSVNVSGLGVGDGVYELRFRRYDNGLSPRRAVENVHRAIADGAVAIIDEGTGIDGSWRIAHDANVPIGIVYQGGIGLVDLEERPNVFRIAPTDRGMSFRLAEYLIPKGLRIGVLTDDSGYGREGAEAMEKALAANPESVAVTLEVPTGVADAAPQVLRAKRAGATALVVWGEPSTIAAVLTAARTSGWDVPVYTPPNGEDPLVRQQLSDHPEWIDGLTFASGRMTAEVGPGPFLQFQDSYEKAFGAQKVGVRTPDGAEVIQPPDYAMYAYDFVNVLAAAITTARKVDGAAIIRALNQVTVTGANGDERGFNEKNHEGVVDDDVYFARFRGMTFAPVKDDLLSATLPTIDQTR
jgi:ABC-type branched-subunit amino acid transport system substrate-binding protein